MAILTNTGSAIMIVPELLERGNYKSWSIFMEDYLISQELWDGIIVPFVFSVDHPLLSESEWRKRNATALNAIKIICGPEGFVLIKYTRSAREALDMLAEMHKTEPETNKSTPKMNVAMASTKKEEEVEEEITQATSEHEEEEREEEEEEITKATSEHEEEEKEKEEEEEEEITKATSEHEEEEKEEEEEEEITKATSEHEEEEEEEEEEITEEEEEEITTTTSEHEEEEITEEEEEEEITTTTSEHEEAETEEEEEEEEEEITKSVSASMIVPVPELLASDNYNRWSIRMKKYLVSQDLWDAVLHDWGPDCGVSKKKWIKKNAAALHAIQISCRPKKFDEIEEITSAKTAWNALKQKHINEHPDDGPVSDIRNYWEKQDFPTMERTQSLFVQNAIHKGNVDAVIGFFMGNPEAENLGFWTGDTSQYYAIIFGDLNIVKALLERTPAVQKDAWGCTAFRYAARHGNTEVVKHLLSKDSTLDLLSMEDDYEEIPVVTACKVGHKEMTDFLYAETPFEILLDNDGKQGSKLLLWCLRSERFDIMFDVLCRDQQRGHILIDENWMDLLDGFAETPTAFISGSGLKFCQRWIYELLKVHIPSDFCVVAINQEEKKFEEIPLPGPLWRLASILLPFLGIKRIHDLMLSHAFTHASLHLICQRLSKLEIKKVEDVKALSKALTRAIENGIYDFLIEMVETNRDLLVTRISIDDDEALCGNFLMNAIAFRQEKIARFLIGLPVGRVFINSCLQENSVLHIAGKLAPDSRLSCISGAALQMQRELQWFKEVESLVSQSVKDAQNKNGETAYQVFDREHNDLLKKAKDWMKELASSYIIVGILIVTIMFNAAFTLPGGNNQTDGFPIFKNKAAFKIYIISDAISLFAAAASVIIFLEFLTSRYNMEDFHRSIPKKLMAGLSTLFISLAAMMIAFCSAIFLMLENRWWVIIPSVLLAGIPVSLFARLQFPLLLEIYVLTYKSPIFSKEKCLASKIKAFFLGKKKIE